MSLFILQLQAPIDLIGYVRLVPDHLNYLASEVLSQFYVSNVSMSTDESGSVCEVGIVLQRIYLYHLTNTYLPTFSLLVIVDITLFFDESETQLAIGFSLTIMLVMYTLFQGVSALFPKTAYLKLVSISSTFDWQLFCT